MGFLLLWSGGGIRVGFWRFVVVPFRLVSVTMI
jgi:hypothetical protein